MTPKSKAIASMWPKNFSKIASFSLCRTNTKNYSRKLANEARKVEFASEVTR